MKGPERRAALRPLGGEVALYSDSKYVIDASNLPLADLWREMLEATRPHSITWHWVRGHDGHAENERVNRLAGEAADAARRR